ncbi:hypothetical protein BX666DRAFT_1882454 [Dichotomocladium elegans]|nr:hypothetical protein BX666DRAFT_1882454 [Dichotomocladium elegans]
MLGREDDACVFSVFVVPERSSNLSSRSSFRHIMFVFGDSYSAIPGTEGSGSTWNRFKKGHAFSNAEIVPNTTRSGGPTWNEFLTGCYEGLPQDCEPQHLFNMAYSGATVSRRLVKVRWPIIADFIQQVRLWKTKVVPNITWTNALVMVWL